MKKQMIITILMLSIAFSATFFAAEDPAATEPPKPWNTSLTAGFNLAEGNSKAMNLAAGFLSEYKSAQHEFKMGFDINYGESETTLDNGDKKTDTTVENGKGYLGYKYLFTERFYAGLVTEAAYDTIADIDLRFMAGPGIGYYFVKSETTSLSLDLGATYIKTEYSEDVILTEDAIEDDTIALRVAERFEYAISKTSKIWQSAEYLPSFDDFAIYLLNAEIGVEAMLTDVMGLHLAAQDKYNSEPPVDKEENDLTITAGLTLKF